MSGIVVAAAIVRGDPPHLLAAQRAYPHALAGRWELPGGKVEAGETDEAALVRECEEELGVTVAVGGRAAPDVPTVDGITVLRTYWATLIDGEPLPLEHADLQWVPAAGLGSVDWLPADGPVIAAIRRALTSSG